MFKKKRNIYESLEQLKSDVSELKHNINEMKEVTNQILTHVYALNHYLSEKEKSKIKVM